MGGRGGIKCRSHRHIYVFSISENDLVNRHLPNQASPSAQNRLSLWTQGINIVTNHSSRQPGLMICEHSTIIQLKAIHLYTPLGGSRRKGQRTQFQVLVSLFPGCHRRADTEAPCVSPFWSVRGW